MTKCPDCGYQAEFSQAGDPDSNTGRFTLGVGEVRALLGHMIGAHWTPTLKSLIGSAAQIVCATTTTQPPSPKSSMRR